MSANRTNSDAATIQTFPVLPNTPTDGQVLMYNAVKGSWLPGLPTIPSADFAIPTGGAGPAAVEGVLLTAIRSDATIPLKFTSEARGDTIARGASAWNRVAIGSVGTVWVSDGTDPSWGTVGTAGLTALGVTFAKLALSAQSQITDPAAASTGNVTIDATSNPRPLYYMAPAGNQTFDPTAATVSQTVTIIKTTTSTNKITLPATAAWTYQPAGASNTAFDLPGTATNSATANHIFWLCVDVPNKIVYVSPAA